MTRWGKRLARPFESHTRISGTMAFTGMNDRVDDRRASGSMKGVYEYLDNWPSVSPKAWLGLRPMTPDGLPIIGRLATENVVIAPAMPCSESLLRPSRETSCDGSFSITMYLKKQSPSRLTGLEGEQSDRQPLRHDGLLLTPTEKRDPNQYGGCVNMNDCQWPIQTGRSRPKYTPVCNSLSLLHVANQTRARTPSVDSRTLSSGSWNTDSGCPPSSNCTMSSTAWTPIWCRGE